jgi:hypothetical protein
MLQKSIHGLLRPSPRFNSRGLFILRGETRLLSCGSAALHTPCSACGPSSFQPRAGHFSPPVRRHECTLSAFMPTPPHPWRGARGFYGRRSPSRERPLSRIHALRGIGASLHGIGHCQAYIRAPGLTAGGFLFLRGTFVFWPDSCSCCRSTYPRFEAGAVIYGSSTLATALHRVEFLSRQTNISCFYFSFAWRTVRLKCE